MLVLLFVGHAAQHGGQWVLHVVNGDDIALFRVGLRRLLLSGLASRSFLSRHFYLISFSYNTISRIF